MERRFAPGLKLLSGLKKVLGWPKKIRHRIELADEVWTDVFLFLSRSNIQKSVVPTNKRFCYIICRYLPNYPYICIYKLELWSKYVRLDFQRGSHNDMKYKKFWKKFGCHIPPPFLRILAVELQPQSEKIKQQKYIDQMMSPEWLRKWQSFFTTTNLQRLESYGQPTVYPNSQHFQAWSSSFDMPQSNKYGYLLPALLNDIALTAQISMYVKWDNATMLGLLGGCAIMKMPAIQQCRFFQSLLTNTMPFFPSEQRSKLFSKGQAACFARTIAALTIT